MLISLFHVILCRNSVHYSTSYRHNTPSIVYRHVWQVRGITCSLSPSYENLYDIKFENKPELESSYDHAQCTSINFTIVMEGGVTKLSTVSRSYSLKDCGDVLNWLLYGRYDMTSTCSLRSVSYVYNSFPRHVPFSCLAIYSLRRYLVPCKQIFVNLSDQN
jgi:hypothetical protein